MSSHYLCKKCLFRGKNFIDIKRHLNKKNKCSKKVESYSYSEDHLFILSLIPYYKGDQMININDISNKNNILENKDKLFELIDNIEKDKTKTCPYCNNKFNKIQDLRSHLILYCFSNEIDKENTNSGNNTINQIDQVNNLEQINNITNNNINNSNNTNILNNITNNITINLDVDSLVPFDKDWDVSHINNAIKQSLILSLVKYTKTLEYILKNEKNINVILDKDSEKGFIYKDNNFEIMNKKDIMEQSFMKIYNHLNNFYDDIKNNNEFEVDNNYLDEQKKLLESKFSKYKNDTNSKEIVDSFISNKFEVVKDIAINNYNKMNNVLNGY